MFWVGLVTNLVPNSPLKYNLVFQPHVLTLTTYSQTPGHEEKVIINAEVIIYGVLAQSNQVSCPERVRCGLG